MRLRILPIAGIDADAKANGHVDPATIDVMRLGHGLQQSCCCGGGIFRALQFLQEHNEFVASLAADGVRSAHAIEQAPGYRLQEFVAHQMSEGVIDVFEAVQIHEQDRGLALLPTRKNDRLVHTIIEECPIGQTGEGVVLGGMGQPVLQCPLLGDIAKHEHRPGDLPFPIVKRGGGIFDEDLPSVALDEDTVGRKGLGPVFLDLGHFFN